MTALPTPRRSTADLQATLRRENNAPSLLPVFCSPSASEKRGGVLCFTGRSCSPPVLLPPTRGRTESLSPRHWALRRRDSSGPSQRDVNCAAPQSRSSMEPQARLPASMGLASHRPDPCVFPRSWVAVEPRLTPSTWTTTISQGRGFATEHARITLTFFNRFLIAEY